MFELNDKEVGAIVSALLQVAGPDDDWRRQLAASVFDGHTERLDTVDTSYGVGFILEVGMVDGRPSVAVAIDGQVKMLDLAEVELVKSTADNAPHSILAGDLTDDEVSRWLEVGRWANWSGRRWILQGTDPLSRGEANERWMPCTMQGVPVTEATYKFELACIDVTHKK